jgi:hypothetical protein
MLWCRLRIAFRRMVSEKVSAAAASQTAATAALLGGKGLKRAAAAALVPLKRAVRANHRRLSKANRINGVMSNMRRLFRGVSR